MRLYSSQGSVKGQFPHRDTHSLNSQVSQAQNAFSVSDNNCAYIIFGPIAQNVVDMAFVVNGNEKAPEKHIILGKIVTRGITTYYLLWARVGVAKFLTG